MVAHPRRRAVEHLRQWDKAEMSLRLSISDSGPASHGNPQDEPGLRDAPDPGSALPEDQDCHAAEAGERRPSVPVVCRAVCADHGPFARSCWQRSRRRLGWLDPRQTRYGMRLVTCGRLPVAGGSSRNMGGFRVAGYSSFTCSPQTRHARHRHGHGQGHAHDGRCSDRPRCG